MTMAAARTVIRDDLLRTATFNLERAEPNDDGEAGDGLTLSGHAAVFNIQTEIDSWEGRFLESIAPGAFRKTFRERTPVLQFDHGRHPLIGSMPLGKIQRAEEDDIGAYVEARLHDNWLTQPVRDAIASESVDGMSFRFTVVKEEWTDAQGKVIRNEAELLDLLYYPDRDENKDRTPLVRTLKELKVPELGPVVFPAYEATDVGVRSGRTTIDLAQLRANPAERKRLARLLFMAEDHDPDEHLSGPDVPGTEPARSGHSESDDDKPPAAGHSSDSTDNDTPPAREDDGPIAQMLARMQADVARGRQYERTH